MDRPVTVPDLLHRRATSAPDAVVLAVGGGDSLTLQEWDHRSNAVARGLMSRGLALGDRVGLIFDNRRWLDLAIAYVAVLKAGGVAVPTGPRFPALDLDRVLTDCEPAMVLAGDDLGPRSNAWPPSRLEDVEAGQPTDPVDVRFDLGDTAELLYPDRAMRRAVARASTHGDLLRSPFGFSGMPAGPFVHAFATGTPAGQAALRLPLCNEGVVAIAAPDFQPDRFEVVVRAHRGVACGLTPSMARAVVARHGHGEGDGGSEGLASVRRIFLSGPPKWAGLVPALVALLPGAEVNHLPGAPPPPPRADDDVAPLVAAQDGMVWHEQFTPASFNLAPLLRRYRGELDRAALEAALNEIVRRHAALRTTFSILDGQGVQVFPPHQPRALDVVDLSGLSAPDQESRLAAIVWDARRRPFDLVAGPLFTPLLVRLAPDDHVMVIRSHHAVYDDWSVGLFRRELSALYSAFAFGEPSPLPELPLGVPEVARQQDAARRGSAGERDRAYWHQELDGAPLSVQLPIDDPTRPVGSPHTPPPPLSVELPAEVTAELRSLARRQRATPFTVLLAAVGVLVQRYTGQDDLLVSTLAASRPTTDVENLIGCFGKKVLVRLRLAGDPPFPELVTLTRRAVMGALAHQGPAYEAVVQEVLGPRAAVHGLTPQVALKFQAAITPRDRLELRGLTTSGVDVPPPPERAAHFLSADDRGADEAPRWGAGLYFGAFLGISVFESSEGGLRLVTEGVFHAVEVERLLAHFLVLLADIAGDPDRPLSELRVVEESDDHPTAEAHGAPLHATVQDAFETHVRRAPDDVAVVCGDAQLTFGELHTAARRRASELAGEPAAAAIALPQSVPAGADLVVAAIGTWMAGRAIATSSPGAGSITAVPGAAYVVDGVTIEHRSLLAVGAGLQSVLFGADGGRRRFCLPPVPASGAFVRGLLALAAGHTVFVARRPLAADPQSYVSCLAKGETDVLDCGAEEFIALLAAGLREALAERRMSGAPPVLVLVTSERTIPPEWWSAWRHIDGAELHVLYGPAASGFGATTGPISDGAVRPSIGRPIPGVKAEVVDRFGRRVPDRAIGRLVLSGAAVGGGGTDGTVDTGRLARWRPDGTLELVGGDGDVDLGGFRVEPARIEAALAGCPGVEKVAVVAHTGHGFPPGARLVAHVVPQEGWPPPTLGSLRRWLWRRLPGYAWPAALRMAATAPVADDVPGDAALLASAWAEARGFDRLGTDDNYWQSFALLDVLAELAAAGSPVAAAHVLRNRTLEALATDVAATSAGALNGKPTKLG